MRTVVPTPIPIVDDPLAGADHKPKHRGRLHQIAFVAAIPASVALVLHATTSTLKIACVVYGLSLTGLLFTSSLYNRCAGTTRLRSWMRWLDHSMIYVLIAGTYTPVCMALLSPGWRWSILGVVWAGALAGIVLKMTALRRFRRVGGVLYLAIGWFALVALPKLWPELTATARVGLVSGGMAYMVGAILLWLRRPNPTKDFGYHEVWHGFVVLGASLHFVMAWLSV